MEIPVPSLYIWGKRIVNMTKDSDSPYIKSAHINRLKKADSRGYTQQHLDAADTYMVAAQKSQGDEAVRLYRKARGDYILAQEPKGAALATDRILKIQGKGSRQAAEVYRSMALEARKMGQRGEVSNYYTRKAEALERQAKGNEKLRVGLRKKLEAAGKA